MPSSTRALPLAMVALVLAASLWLAGSYPLLDPDEGRNAEVAREMVASGDLVIPHLAGMPYLDKPPALFWMVSAAVRAFGATPFAARLPAAIAAALTLLVLARLAQRQRGAAFSASVVALTATAPLFAVLSAYVIFDMPLTLCVTFVWTMLARELESGPHPGRRAAMFAAVTLGLLLKGPVMLAWALGGSLAAALLLRDRDALRWLAWWPGWIAVVLIAGGWFALASARHPEYWRYAFLEESLERLTSGSFRREQPWWFVPAVLAGGALPWSLATPWAERRVRGDDADSQRTVRVALGFVLFAAVFFTLSRSKLVTYLLPALPALAWLAASAWSDPRPQRRSGWILFALYLPLAVACEAMRYVEYIPGVLAPPAVLGADRAMALTFAALAILALVSAIACRPRLAFVGALAFTPIVLVCGQATLAVGIEPESGPGAVVFLQTGAPLAHAIAASGGGPVRYEGCYSPGTDFLLGRGARLVRVGGRETTSNYQLRYRQTLIARQLWTPRDAAAPDDPAVVVVRPASAPGTPPAGWSECFRDRRFVAFRLDSGG
jgi:4-amino-4-deoxy-L-arabinose transferase-like glycosyltransferase